jgi:serine/threonine-protein kinase/endoribonuclease IRE1
MTPHISDDGEITLGLKKTTAFLVDAKTGRVVRTYKFDNSASKVGVQVFEGNAVMLSKDAGELVESGGVDVGTFKHLVYITRTDYVLQHHAPNSTEILWNVAFADSEAEFRCQGIQSSFGGVSLNANEDTDVIEWQLPCQMKRVAF